MCVGGGASGGGTCRESIFFFFLSFGRWSMIFDYSLIFGSSNQRFLLMLPIVAKIFFHSLQAYVILNIYQICREQAWHGAMSLFHKRFYEFLS